MIKNLICILMVGMMIQGWWENIQEYSMHKLNEFDDEEGMSSRVYFKVRHWDIVSLKLKLSHSITVTKTDCPTATYILTLWVFDFLGLKYTEICPTLLSSTCLHMCVTRQLYTLNCFPHCKHSYGYSPDFLTRLPYPLNSLSRVCIHISPHFLCSHGHGKTNRRIELHTTLCAFICLHSSMVSHMTGKATVTQHCVQSHGFSPECDLMCVSGF